MDSIVENSAQVAVALKIRQIVILTSDDILHCKFLFCLLGIIIDAVRAEEFTVLHYSSVICRPDVTP